MASWPTCYITFPRNAKTRTCFRRMFQQYVLYIHTLNTCTLRLRTSIYVSCGVEWVVSRWSSFKCGRSSFAVGIREADT